MENENKTGMEISRRKPRIKAFGVGDAGLRVVQQMVNGGLAGVEFAAINSHGESFVPNSIPEMLVMDLNRLGNGQECEAAQKLRALVGGASVVMVVTGLGGATGSRISPVLARAAKESGAVVLAFVLLPFECEGGRKQSIAANALDELKRSADAVICLPNKKVLKLIDENTSMLDTFKLTNELLIEGVRGLWRLLTFRGPIEIDFEEFCALVRDRHAESAFATAEAMGATRSREVMDKLMASPMLDSGQLLSEADAVLISLTAGPDLTMTEVNRVMQEIHSRCEHAQVMMGAAIDESYRERLAVTVIAARKSADAPALEAPPRSAGQLEGLDRQLLTRSPENRPTSRFVPPAPSLPQEKMEQMLARQHGGKRRKNSKMHQSQLPLEILSKGRFDKSEPTIHKGEDLDVPTYIRRGVALN
jgi:cell division protein FtsZ